jgi:phosphatidylserine decarboxylase
VKRFSFFAHEGIRWILLAVILVTILWVQFGFYVASPALLLLFLVMRFYYDPDRELPSYPLGVMSPVDGVVVSVDLFHDPFLDRASQRIRIQTGMLGVYYGRSPTEGKMMEFWPFLSEDKQEYTRENTSGALWIKTDEDDDVTVIATKKSGWGHTRCEIQAGERVGQARRCGRFPVGSCLDIMVEENAFIEVAPGQRVLAGIDRLATFNHDVEEAE